jgi:hypothetical protein
MRSPTSINLYKSTPYPFLVFSISKGILNYQLFMSKTSFLAFFNPYSRISHCLASKSLTYSLVTTPSSSNF